MYAILDDGWRSIGEGADIVEGETLVDDVPEWLSEKVRYGELRYMEGLGEPFD